NKAGDDAAGLAISEKMRGQIRGLEMASKNAQDGVSLIQTAEGALSETHDILQRMRELTVQAGNTGTQETEDLQAIQDELDSLIEELGGVDGGSSGISERTQYNGKNLLNGDIENTKLTFQIGANQGQQLEVNIKEMSAEALDVHEINVMGVQEETEQVEGETVTTPEAPFSFEIGRASCRERV